MMSAQTELLDSLRDLKSLAEKFSLPRRAEGWQLAAIKTVTDNVDHFIANLESALNSQVVDDQKKTACEISGIQKGISDLGLFDRIRDSVILESVDRVSKLSNALCFDKL